MFIIIYKLEHIEKPEQFYLQYSRRSRRRFQVHVVSLQIQTQQLSAVAPDNGRRRRGLLLAAIWWSRDTELCLRDEAEHSVLPLGFTRANPRAHRVRLHL